MLLAIKLNLLPREEKDLGVGSEIAIRVVLVENQNPSCWTSSRPDIDLNFKAMNYLTFSSGGEIGVVNLV